MTSGFASLCLLAHRPTPHMRFVFLGPGVCLHLPSDSTSRWTPLVFGYGFPSSGPQEGLPVYKRQGTLQVTSRFAFAPRLSSASLGASRHAWRTKRRPRTAARGLRNCSWRVPTLPHSLPCSTIGATGLNFRVRDGNGCLPCAIHTRNYGLFLCDVRSADETHRRRDTNNNQDARIISITWLNTLLCLHR